jgi:hypothetical protein
MTRKLSLALATTVAAAALTGCASLPGYAVRSESAAQQDVLGDVVHVGATLCADTTVDGGGDGGGMPTAAIAGGVAMPQPGDGTCDADGGSGDLMPSFAQDGGLQFFAAFLVPQSATAPSTATATLPAGLDPSTATLTRKPSLDEALQLTDPAPDGERWVGYISPVVGAASDQGETPQDVAAGLRSAGVSDDPNDGGDGSAGDWTAAADFTLSRGPGGLPAPAAFTHAVAGGVRMAYPEAIYDGVDPTGFHEPQEAWGLQLLDTRPVDCQEVRAFPYDDLYGTSLRGLDEDSGGRPLLPTTSCGRQSAPSALALKDLRGSGDAVTVNPGQAANVPFTLRYVGAAPGPAFALSATTALPGAPVATASPATLTPSGDGFQNAAVAVTVPAGTAPGDYAVTLTAAVGAVTRTATGTITVGTPGAGTTSANTTPNPTGLEDAGATGVSGASVVTRERALEFRGLDRSGFGPDKRSVNIGDVICHKTVEACGWVTWQLSLRWEQLHAGAEVARASARARVRMVVIGAGALSVPAGGRRHIRVTLPKGVVKLIDGGAILHAVAAVRPARDRAPITHRIDLRRG